MSKLVFRSPHRAPGICFQPQTYAAIQRGIHQIVRAVKPSLGPITRYVAVDKYTGNSLPELIDDGAMIARRVIEIRDPDANTGAMMIRGMLYRLSERVGDGSATAAVLYAAVFDESLKLIQAGANPMMLNQGLNTALAVALDALQSLIVPVKGREDLCAVARTVCHDDVMAEQLGTIFYTIGEFGLLQSKAGRARENYFEFVLGHYWTSNGLHGGSTADTVSARHEALNAGIFVSDLEIQQAQELVPIIRAALLAELDTLVIMAQELSPEALALIQQIKLSKRLHIIGIKPPYIDSDRMRDGLEDVAILCGAQAFYKAAGESTERVQPEHLGTLRRFWADKEGFAFTGGGGNPHTIRSHVQYLRKSFTCAEKREPRQRLKDRLGRLLSGGANFEVGGMTKPEMDFRLELLKRSEATLRAALRQGLLPGGGSAYLACRKAVLAAAFHVSDEDEAAAYRALARALQAPFRALMHNSGLEPEPMLARVNACDKLGYGYDLLRGCFGDMLELGVVDVAEVMQDALRTAVKSAALALTVDTIVHKKNPIVMQNPE